MADTNCSCCGKFLVWQLPSSSWYCWHCSPANDTGWKCGRGHAVQRDGRVAQDNLTRDAFTLLSYNILAQCYVRVPEQPWNAFAHCADSDIGISRRAKICEQLCSCDADVVCCQEVEFEEDESGRWHLPLWLEPVVNKGYTAVLPGFTAKQWKQQASRNERVIGVRTVAGLVSFYRSSKFAVHKPPAHGSRSITLFLSLLSGVLVTVSNVHLEGNQEKVDTQIKQLESTVSKARSSAAHFVLCGDFNSELSERNPRMFDFVLGEAGGLGEKYNVTLRAPNTGPTWAEPASALTLDHVVHSSSLSAMITTPSMSDDVKIGGLPCHEHPSDHLPIGVRFSVVAPPPAGPGEAEASSDVLLSSEEQERLQASLEDLNQNAPLRPKGKPTPEQQKNLKAFSKTKKEWIATLTVQQATFVKKLEKRKK